MGTNVVGEISRPVLQMAADQAVENIAPFAMYRARDELVNRRCCFRMAVKVLSTGKRFPMAGKKVQHYISSGVEGESDGYVIKIEKIAHAFQLVEPAVDVS